MRFTWKNNKKVSIAKRTLIISSLFVMLAVAVGGFLRQNFNYPTTVAADTTFSENKLEGISNPSTVSDEQNNIEVYRSVSPGVVLITTKGEQTDFLGERDEQSGTGSGVVIDKRGYILTNEHVVRGVQNMTVNLGGDKVFQAKVVGRDQDTDLAVIKVEAPPELLTVIPFGDSDALTVGQKVLAIGNPFGLDRTLTTGVISGLQRPIRSRNNHQIEGAIQTDASINPGNSGGPLLDSNGRMIGVNSQILSPSGASNGIGFAIPVSIVKRVVPQLIESGKVNRPRLGVATKDIAELSKQGIQFPIENGLLIVTVAQTSAAEKAGLRGTTQGYDGRVELGDIITAVDGKAIKNVDELYNAIDGKQIGDTINLEVWRDGSKKTIAVKLEAQSTTDQDEQTPPPTKKPRNQQRKY